MGTNKHFQKGVEMFNVHVQNILGWSDRVGIFSDPKCNADTQHCKFLEEWHETKKAIFDGDLDEIRDGIGDQFVCIVNMAKFLGFEVEEPCFSDQPLAITNLLQNTKKTESLRGMLAVYISTGWAVVSPNLQHCLQESVDSLDKLAGLYGLTLNECIQTAWGAIKDRKGKMIDGKFVKEIPADVEMVPRSRIVAIEAETAAVEEKLSEVRQSCSEEMDRLNQQLTEARAEIERLKTEQLGTE